MDYATELDSIFDSLNTVEYSRNGIYSSLLWTAARNHAQASIDEFNAGERMSEARAESLDKRQSESEEMISWAFLRTPKDLRPAASKILENMINRLAGGPTEKEIQTLREMQDTIDDDDEMQFSYNEIKEVLTRQRQEQAARIEKAKEFAVTRLERAFKAAEALPSNLNDGFTPTQGQARLMAGTVVRKGRAHFLSNQLKAMQPGTGEQFRATLLGNNRILKAAVKRAEKLQHDLLQASENDAREPIEVADEVAIH